MICRINEIPEYVSKLNLSKQVEINTRNAHNSVVNELLALKTKDNIKVFKSNKDLNFNATILNTEGKTETVKNEIIATANSKIEELNAKYFNAVKLLNAEGKQFLAVSLKNFALLQQEKENHIEYTGRFFNFKAHADNQIQESIKNNILVFLNKIGVDVKQADTLLNDLKPNAIADILRKTIRYTEGNENKLPEEAAHFLIELLPKNHPVYEEAFTTIVNYPIYEKVKKEYGKVYNYDETKLRKEAIAQLIAQSINEIEEPINLLTDKIPYYKKPLQWLQKILNYFKSLFEFNKEDAFTNLKWRLLNADISDLSYNNVIENLNADGIYFSLTRYEQLAEHIENSKYKEEIIKQLEGTYNNLSKLKKQIESANPLDFKSTTAKTVLFLKESVHNLENTSISAAVTFATMVLETNILLRDYKNSILEIRNITDVNAKLLQWQNLMLSTKVLIDNIVPQIQRIDNYLDDTDMLKKECGEISLNAKKINFLINEEALKLTSTVYKSFFTEKLKELKEKQEEKKKPLLATRAKLIQENASKSDILKIDRKLEEIENEFLTKAPTDENIDKLFTGKLGDASVVNYMIQAAALNGNIAISELDNYIQQSLNESIEQKIKVANLAQTAFDKFTKATGLSANNNEKLYENIIEVTKLFDGYDKDGLPKYRFQKSLVSKYNKEYLIITKKFDYDINALNREIYKEKDLTKINELKLKLRTLIREKKKWDLENMQLKYTDEYTKVELLLDEDLGNGETVNSFTQGIYTDLDFLYSKLKYATDQKTISDLYEDIDETNFKLKELQNTYNKTGIQLKVAQKLQEYKSKMAEMVDYKLTEEGIANHKKYISELAKKLNTKEITKESYKLLLDRSYSRTYTKEYWDRKKELAEELKTKLELIAPHLTKANLAIKEDIAELYKKIEEISKPFRDYNGELDGTPLESDKDYENKILQIKKYEEQIEEYKKALIKFTGLSKNDLELIHKLRLESYNAPDDNKKIEIKKQIDAIHAKAKNNAIPISLKESINETLNKINELTKSENTSYYNKIYNEKLQQIEVEEFSKEEPYLIYGSIYIWDDTINKWISTDNELEDVVIQSNYAASQRELAIKKTEWFKNNHIIKPVFNEVTFQLEDTPVPIYIWRISKPTDEEKYITKEPSFSFKTRIVKDKYLTHLEYLPKQGKFVNENYKKLTSAQKEFLEFLTDLYTSFQNEILPRSKRLGLMLPTIPKSKWDKMVDLDKQKIEKSIKNVVESAKRLVTHTEQDIDYLYGELDHDIFGDLPVLFTSKLDAELQTSDALGSILMFINHLIDYKQLKQTKPLADAVLQTVSNPENAPVKNPELLNAILKATKIFNANPEEERLKGPSIMQKHIESMMNRFYYNKNQEKEIIGNFNIGKIVDTSLGTAAIGSLGGKPFSAVKNLIAGEIQSFLTSKLMKEKIYTSSALATAISKSPKILLDLGSDYLKMGNHTLSHQLLIKFDAFQGEFVNEFGQKISATALKSSLNFTNLLMIPKNIVEVEQQVVNAMAVLETIQVKQEEKFIPLSEAFELKDGVITAKFEIPKKTIEEAINKIKYANIVTNGNFNKRDAVVAQQHSLGRMLLFMNKFIPPMLHYRWSDTHYNSSINEITTGYQKLFLKRILEDIKDRQIPFTNTINYTEDEKRAALTNLWEMGIILGFSLTFAALGGDDPDKYKKLKNDPVGYWKAQALNILLTVNQENKGLHPIFGIDNIAQKVKSPFPVARLYTNLTKLLFDLNLLDEDVYYKKDTGLYKKGDWKGLAAIYKLTGIEGIILTGNSIEQLKRAEQAQPKN